MLGWLTTEQLSDRFKELPAVKAFHAATTRMSVRANTVMNMSDRVKRQWEALRREHGNTKDHAFIDFLLESTRSQIWAMHDLDAAENKHLGEPDAALKTKHAELRKQWDALPEPYRKFFGQLQNDFALKYQAKVNGFRQNIINSHYPEGDGKSLTRALVDQAAALRTREQRKQFLKEHGTSKLAVDAYRALWQDLDDHAREFPARLKGPYFPLMRFGNHVVTVRSNEFRAAEKALADKTKALEDALSAENHAEITNNELARDALEKQQRKAKDPVTRARLGAQIEMLSKEIERLQAPLEALRKQHSEARTAVRRLKGSESNYRVEFYESLGEASARRRQLEQHFTGRDVEIKQGLKDEYIRTLDGVTPSFMRRLEDRLTSALPETEAASVRRSVRELYMQMLPERSALKAQMERLNVSGVKSEESLRAYAASSVRDAWYISRLENQEPLRESMNELRFNRDNLDAKIVGQELAKRVAQNFQFDEHKWMSAATNATYLTYLGMSPSFLAVQLTQPFIVSMPAIAARHGTSTIGQLTRGFRQAAQVLRASFDKRDKMGFTADPQAAADAGIISANEAKMLQTLFDSGRIDITITHDLGAAASGRSEGWLGKATAMSAWPAQQAEVINRVATALAAYRLEKAQLMRNGATEARATERAIEYADRIVSETHLNYAAENRARFMHANAWGGWGKIMFQFRSFQQGMLYLVFKNLIDGVRGDKEAMRAAVYLAGMQLASAGVTGLPFAAPAMFAASLIYQGLTDDDEEKDLRELMYQAVESVGGETLANALAKGLPTLVGIDFSQRVGMGDIMNPAPFVNPRAEGRDMVAAYWIAVTGGAPFGMVSNWAEAVKQAGDGHYAKAMTFALPKFLADPVRGAQMGTKGLLDSNGNPILNPEDLSTAEIAARVLGFQPVDVVRTQEKRRAFFEAREKRSEGRAAIVREQVQNRLRGEPVDWAKIQAYNARHPGNRITMSDILRAATRRQGEEQMMRRTGGVPVRRSEEDLAEELGLFD